MGNIIGKRMKELRRESGLKQKDVAEALGLNPKAFAHYEAGRRKPNYELLGRIVNFYGVSADYLLGFSNLKRGRLAREEELIRFLPEQTVRRMKEDRLRVLLYEEVLSEGTKDEIIDVLRKHGYLHVGKPNLSEQD